MEWKTKRHRTNLLYLGQRIAYITVPYFNEGNKYVLTFDLALYDLRLPKKVVLKSDNIEDAKDEAMYIVAKRICTKMGEMEKGIASYKRMIEELNEQR